MATEKERDTHVYLAKLAEQAERYEEMVESMKKVAKLDVELTVEERNLLSVGYKNVIGARRASWRIMSSIEQKEESKGNEHNVKLIKSYRQNVEEELSKICNDILTIIDKHLIPSSNSGEATVFYYKIWCPCEEEMNRPFEFDPVYSANSGKVMTTRKQQKNPKQQMLSTDELPMSIVLCKNGFFLIVPQKGDCNGQLNSTLGHLKTEPL
ncbi:hypothetical protein U1Q18_016747 [Sarracenia purpurea var. burkii]